MGKHLFTALFIIRERNILKLNVFGLHLRWFSSIGQFFHMEQLVYIVYGIFNRFRFIDIGGKVHQWAYNPQREDQAHNKILRGQASSPVEIHTNGERSQEGGRQYRRNKIHQLPGALIPFEGVVLERFNRLCEFFIGTGGLIKRLDNFNALHILYNHAVHIVVGLHVIGIELIKILHHYGKGDKSKRYSHQHSQSHTPVNADQINKDCHGEQQVGDALRDHVGQRQLNRFHTVYQYTFQFPHRLSDNCPQRRFHQPLGKGQTNILQNGVCGYVGQAR